MTVVLKTTKQIPFDDLLSGRLKRHGIKIVTGYEAGPILYLCLAGTALRACPDDNGYCDFVVPDNGDLPLSIFDAIMHEFDCGIERLVDDRGRVVTSLDRTQAGGDRLPWTRISRTRRPYLELHRWKCPASGARVCTVRAGRNCPGTVEPKSATAGRS